MARRHKTNATRTISAVACVACIVIVARAAIALASGPSPSAGGDFGTAVVLNTAMPLPPAHRDLYAVDPLADRTAFFATQLRKHCVGGAAPTPRGQRCCLVPGDEAAGAPALRRCLPSVLIAGAQKSGTTALVAYLSLHPQFVPTRKKEQHFFDIDKHYRKGVLRRYVAAFPALPDARAVVTGEASPSYIAAPHTCRRIAALLPRARIVVILRDPIGRLWSELLMKMRRVEAQNAVVATLAAHAEQLYACMERELPPPALDGDGTRTLARPTRAEVAAVDTCLPAALKADKFGYPKLKRSFIAKAGGKTLPDWRACFVDSPNDNAWEEGVQMYGGDEDGGAAGVEAPAGVGGAPLRLNFQKCGVKLFREKMPDTVAAAREEIGRISACLGKPSPPLGSGAEGALPALRETRSGGGGAPLHYARGTMARCFPKNTTMISALNKNYVWRGLYAMHLEQCYAHIESSKVLVVHDAALRAHPVETLRRVHAHVGLPRLGSGADRALSNEGAFFVSFCLLLFFCSLFFFSLIFCLRTLRSAPSRREAPLPGLWGGNEVEHCRKCAEPLRSAPGGARRAAARLLRDARRQALCHGGPALVVRRGI
jgi:hypothetical protein